MEKNRFYILSKDYAGCFSKGSFVYLLNVYDDLAQVNPITKEGHIVNFTEQVHIKDLVNWNTPAAKVLYALK